jgi:hypothetical protein
MKPLVLAAAVLVTGMTGVIGVALTSPTTLSVQPPELLSDSARIDSFRVALEKHTQRESHAPALNCRTSQIKSGDLDQDGILDIAVQFDCAGQPTHDPDQGNGYTEIAVFTGEPFHRQLIGRLQRNEQDADLGRMRLVGIQNGRMELEMCRYVSGDKRCCPTRVTRERYAVSGHRFVASGP